ncbi:ATP-binding cassette domain-containing protein [Nocardioides sp.]|uniref:ATP-binding cassette domain-containing protein n=1 Tax=Nocardioides sp. TaxID=35761 RepID=UPI0031FF11B5|nr:Monosaccharide-transporting ATPase [Nocardioides sp.]
MDQTIALRVRDISKSYPGVRALSGADLEVEHGRVHGVVGENGAGKSTLMAVVSGAIRPDTGNVEICGRLLDPPTPDRARELGVAIVHQEPALLPDLSVAENIYLKVPPSQRPGTGALRLWASDCLAAWDPEANIDVDARVEQLTAEERFIVEIAAALAALPELLILDEPTEHLGRDDVDRLFARVRTIAGSGCAVVYISHRIHEVKQICDSLTVLRDGEVQGHFAADALSEDDIVALIVGRDLDATFPGKGGDLSRTRLELEGFHGGGFNELSLSVAAGEVIGLAGIEGNGQREVLRSLAGMARSHGAVKIDDHAVRVNSRRSALGAGIGYLPGDRHREGILPELSVRENIELRNLSSISTAGVVVGSRSTALVERAVASLDIKTPSMETPMSSLSGGNQQKAILAGLLATCPRVILVDEPTQGVDVGAKVEIYGHLRDMARETGVAVVVVSSDAFELAGLCDRVLVFSRGSVVATLSGHELSESAITSAALMADTHRTTSTGRRRLTWLSGDTAPVALIALTALLVAVLAGQKNPLYWSDFNITSLLALVVPLAAVAMGQATVMMTGGIDLSVGPLMGFLVVVGSFFLTADDGPPRQLLGWALMFALAALVGLVNWVLIDLLRLPALVATLATFFALQSFSLLLRPTPGGIIDSGITATLTRQVWILPGMFVAVVLLAIALQLALRRTAWGIRLRAVGSDPDRAALDGIRPGLVRLRAYLICSLLAAVGAVALLVQVGSGDPAAGTNYTLISISAAVIGGASIFGGRGSYVGALLGAFLVQQVIGAIPFLLLSTQWESYLVGIMTLVAVAIFSKFRQLSKVE